MTRILIVVLFLLGGIADAQPQNAVGKPLPDGSLPAGTVSVRAVAGQPTQPVTGIVVTLAIAGGKTLTSTTDAKGRAQFDGVAAQARVTVSVPSTAPDLARGTFVVPATGGIRMMLSTVPWKPSVDVLGTASTISLRTLSGAPRPDRDTPVGTFVVRLSYDDLADPKPPANVEVTLVGYAADGKVSIARKSTDVRGTATFTGLDTSLLTAYYAFASLARGAKIDRLIAQPFVPDTSAGVRVMLSSHKRTATDAAIDPASTGIPKNKVRVEVSGIPDPAAAVELVDAATGRVLAKAVPKAPDKHALFDLATRPGQVLYAQTKARGESYRSEPIVQLADRGALLTVSTLPRLMHRFDMIAIPESDKLVVQVKFYVDHNAWIPLATKGGIEIPLPVGFTDAVIADEGRSTATAKLTKRGLLIAAPLPPGGVSMIAGFDLPYKNGKATVTMDLPGGVVGSRLRVEQEPGVALELPPGMREIEAGRYLVVENISIATNKSIQFSVTAPKFDPEVLALTKACKSLEPNRYSPLVGKPVIDFTGKLLDGKPFRLSSLKGKLLVVTFNGTFHRLLADQATLGKLAVPGAEIVNVLSGKDPAEIKKAFGDLKMRVVLDPPVGDDALGPITGSWGITAVPETFIVDRTGTIRLHFINQRDWSKADAATCLKAIK